MAYEGEVITSCIPFDFTRTHAVIVSGVKANRYGHMLLNTGGALGNFFQVSEVYGVPRFMNALQFQRYLKENGKYIITVIRVSVPRPEMSATKLEELLSRKWVWGVVTHNCESFVEEIIMAGGGPKLHRGMLSLPLNSTNQCRSW